MIDFPTHTLESAPEASRPALEAARAKFGMLPNILGKLASSPAATHGYLAISGAFAEHARLDPAEQQVVLIATSVENGCEYCVAAHSTLAPSTGLSEEALAALRSGGPLPDPRLDAIARFTRAVVRGRGWVDEAQQREFLDAGFEPAHMLDVVAGVAAKTLSNYANHLTRPEVDRPFQARVWSREQVAAGD